MGKIVHLIVGILVAVCLAMPCVVFGAGFIEPMDRPAVRAKNPAGAVLIDVTLAGSRIVAVGERGIITYSDDSGNTWKQANVPTSVTLTAVCFPNPDNGWAVGHAGIVLNSTDAGETWTLKLDGVVAAEMIYDSAKSEADKKGPEDNAAQTQLYNAQLFVDDGPDKPFLDIHFKNEREGFIIGAYGLIFRTQDAGNTWQPWLDRTENEGMLNLYAIHASGDMCYIAGEQGLFLISTDGGSLFKRVDTPYIGTFFDIITASSGEILLVGLLGNAYWSTDQGATFNKAQVSGEVSFSSAICLDDGTMVFSNQGGVILKSNDNGRTITTVPDAPRLAPISSIIRINKDTLMTVGYGGAIPVKLSAEDMQGKGVQR
ncbi:MAG: hypothetical protein JW944_05745 [Deltaproteobacteria bacterium]|nr:hypothetical protein [Deltaproteobacteria bacterium]